VPSQFRFCGVCGAPQDSGQAPLDPELEERKVVTVLFADLAASTELAARLDPEDLRAVLRRFFAVQQLLRETLDMADGVRLDRIKVPSAAQGAGWLKLNAAAWVAATLAHQRRHLGQARALTVSPGFPR